MKKYNFVPVILLLFVALFFRFYRLSDIPFGLNNDAAWEGSAALDMLRGNVSTYLPYAQQGWRGEGIIRLIVALFIALFGNNPLNIRLATSIFGIGLILPVYYLVKNLFDKRLAFVTTFLLSISGWHIIMSRSGWRAVCLPFFSTLAFYYLFKGLESRNKIHFALSGIMLSLATFYTYDAGRIVPFFFAMWIAILFFFYLKVMRKQVVNLVTLLTSCVIVSIPMIIYAVTHWENFIGRSRFLFDWNFKTQASIGLALLSNAKNTVLMFINKGNGNDFFVNDPLVDKPVSYFFVLGFVVLLIAVVKNRRKEHFFMLFWFLFSLIPGMLSLPNGNRAIGAIPSVYFIAALGMIYLSNTVSRIFRQKRFEISSLFVSIVLVLSGALTYLEYFGPNRREIPGLYPKTLIATEYAKSIWNDYDIYLTDNYPRELLTYYLYRENTDPFAKNYTWVENNAALLNVSREMLPQGMNDKLIPYEDNSTSLLEKRPEKGRAFIMFVNASNERVADIMIEENPKATKSYLWYINAKIKRKATLVVTVQPEKTL